MKRQLGLEKPKNRFRKKHKATPAGYPGEGPTDIDVGFKELTKNAFAVWMRLMVVSQDELRSGRTKLSKILGYSVARSNVVMRELKRKGYIAWIKTYGKPSQCVILRRAKIGRQTNFFRIKHALSGCVENSEGKEFNHDPIWGELAFSGRRKTLGKNRAITFPPQTITFPPQTITLPPQTITFLRIHAHNFYSQKKKSHNSLPFSEPNLFTLRAALRGNFFSTKPVKRKKFIDENTYMRNFDPQYRELIAKRILLEKQRRKLTRSSAKQSVGLQKSENEKIEFRNFDQRGNPEVSFDPDSPLREKMIQVLSRSARDPERKNLLAKLGVEFGRIYTRYRRAAEMSILGMKKSPYAITYEIPEKEKHLAEEAGMWCVIKGITPRYLLEFWHKHIRTFANRKMKIPPLSLMRSPMIVDQAVCAFIGGDDVEVEREESKDPRPKSKNSFADESSLDKRARRLLESAGFDTRDYNDRFLRTIQGLAETRASGEEIFLSAKIKPMVELLSEKLYR